MFILLSAAALSSASAYAADAETFRASYSKCLTEFLVENLDNKTTNSAFKKAIVNACSDQRSAMAAAMKKDEMDFGSDEAEASAYAEEEVGGLQTSIADAYGGYLSGNTRPVIE